MYEAPVISNGFDTQNKSTSIPVLKFTNTEHPYQGGRYSVASFFGFGSIFRTPVASLEDAQAALNGRSSSIEDLILGLSGNVALCVIDHFEKKPYFITDFYGGGKHFIWQSESAWAVSSSLPDLVAFLESEKVAVGKSLESAALVGFVGYGGGAVESSYDGIRVSEQFEYITCQSDGSLTLTPMACTDSVLGLGSTNSATHEELLNVTATQIMENVQDFSAYPAAHHIVQLTGGLDSRTVFSGLIASGLQSSYSTYTYGLEESLDVQIARNLSAEYKVTTTSHSGMRSVMAASDPDMQHQWSLLQTAGLTSVTPVSLGMLRVPNAVVLAGGWGEMYRGGYPDYPDPSASQEEKIQWILNWVLRTGSPYHGSAISFGGLFSPQMVEQSREYANRILLEIEEKGIPSTFVSEWLYLRWSTRFNVAETTRVSSPFVHRADPLCTTSMMQLIFNTPFEDRRNGSLQLDLIRTLSDGMERLPFDKEYLTSEYRSSRNIGPTREFSNNTSTHRVLEVGKPHLVTSVMTKPQKPTEADKKESLRVKMPVRFIVRAKSNQLRLKHYLENYSSEMAAVFDMSTFKNLVDRNPRTRPEYRRLESLTSALDWYFGAART